MSEQKPLLWKVIDEAWWSLVDTSDLTCAPPDCDQAACVIRALRDWLVPEGEREPRCKEPTYEWVQWNERQRLRTLLTTEADRAERGDQPTSQEH